MIRELSLRGVTVFLRETHVDFAGGLNVIVGGNDTGKSHLMRLLYALCRWMERSPRREFPEKWAEEYRLQHHLLRVFAAQQLSSLVSRRASSPSAFVQASFVGEKVPPGSANLAFAFNSQEENGQGISISAMPDRFLRERALFIPARDILSLFPCYVQVGKHYPDLLDGASQDLCRALEPRPTASLSESMRRVLKLIHTTVQGRLQRSSGARFLFQRGKGEPLELSLLAEGFKRVCTLGMLLENGSLRAGDTLFWDEPEMNLNAAQLPLLCGTILELCDAGVQLILTTHSLFLLRELMIHLQRSSFRAIPRRFIGLHASGELFGAVQVQEGESADELGPLDSLQAETEQADRYLSQAASSASPSTSPPHCMPDDVLHFTK